MEEVAPRFQLMPDDGSIDNVAVMGDGEGAGTPGHGERLQVLQAPDIRSRIPDMPDARRSRESGKFLLGEHMLDQAGLLVASDLPVRTGCGDTAALLSPVLQILQGRTGHMRRVRDTPHAHDATFFVQLPRIETGFPHIRHDGPGRP